VRKTVISSHQVQDSSCKLSNCNYNQYSVCHDAGITTAATDTTERCGLYNSGWQAFYGGDLLDGVLAMRMQRIFPVSDVEAL
jgi:hypothetical protein